MDVITLIFQVQMNILVKCFVNYFMIPTAQLLLALYRFQSYCYIIVVTKYVLIICGCQNNVILKETYFLQTVRML